MFVAGAGLYGKVHESRKGPFIATFCTHVFFFPLEPLDSYIVTKADFPRFAGVKIPLYAPSVRAASVRSLSVVGVALALMASMISSMVWGAGRELYTWWTVTFGLLVALGLASTIALVRSFKRERWAPREVEEMMERALSQVSARSSSSSPLA